MKKLIISCMFLLFTAGCFNYKELNDYSIVTGISIDKFNDKYEVSVLIANTPKNDTDKVSDSSKIVVYSGIGDSIFSAIKDIGLISPKELYLGHFSILVISEDIAQNGINSIIDLFLREPNSKKNFLVAISKGCKAKDTLKIITPISSVPSQSIVDNLLSTTKLQGIIANTYFNEMLANIMKPGIENAINSVTIIGDTSEGANKKNVENSQPNTYIKLDTLGLFKNYKLITWTNKEESVGINIIRNKTNEMYINIKYEDKSVIFNATGLKTSIKASLKNSTPVININIDGKAKLVETLGDINFSDNKVIKLLNQKINQEITNYINKGILVAFKNNTDVFGFGLKFYQEYPKYYKSIENWDSKLKDIQISINSNIKFQIEGSSQISLGDYNG